MRYILTALAILSLIAPVSATAKPHKRIPRVSVQAVQLKSSAQQEKYVGHVRAIESAQLQARVQGYLTKVCFSEGAFVEKGDLLYVIEQAPYQAKVQAAQGRVKQAEAKLFQAKTRLHRLRSAQSESVPQTKLDDAKAAKELALGTLQEARANLREARINLDYTTIEAPFSGQLGESFHKKGDLVGPSAKPLAEIVQMDPIRVVFSVSENNIPLVQKAMHHSHSQGEHQSTRISLRFPDGTKYVPKGHIEFMNNKVDPDTGTISVWACFDNPQGRLVPGGYVNVFLETRKGQMHPAIPQVAVLRDSKGCFVFVVNQKNRAKKRRIRTGVSKGSYVIVESGLHKGEKVVIQGIQGLSDGMRVKIQAK